MTYEECTRFLEELPFYQRTGASAIKPGFRNIRALLAGLGHPEKACPSIHIAGTNGKGSVAHILTACLEANGYRTGLHTSPHFLDIRERMRIGGALCKKALFIELVERVAPLIENIKPSYYEATLALSLACFAEEKVDIAIVETGLGGRLDATNVLKPEVAVITSIGLDHTAILGDTIAEIAREKGGIIKEDTPLILGRLPEEARTVLYDMGREKRAAIHEAMDPSMNGPYETDLNGPFHQENIQTGMATLLALKEDSGWAIEEKQTLEALKAVKKCSGLHGRWELLAEDPHTICDIAHNEEALGSQREALNNETYKTLHLVVGFSNDKEPDKLLPHLPAGASYYPCRADIQRGLSINDLNRALLQHGIETTIYESVAEAVEGARTAAGPDDLVLITGSAYVVAEAMEMKGSSLDQE